MLKINKLYFSVYFKNKLPKPSRNNQGQHEGLRKKYYLNILNFKINYVKIS